MAVEYEGAGVDFKVYSTFPHGVSVSAAGVDAGWLCYLTQEGAGMEGQGCPTPLLHR